ncbi:MAG: hypothetical protein KDA88_09480 [Planctomycetaceae bacterium]|nr:hypothetical protein [Planctomycetaceae bacterium]MCA9032282.1 hypothetical protein [Planctomycetaceae bacterium]MCB9952312.1 hypothetical protein [Planctomycetaceae bacterium]
MSSFVPRLVSRKQILLLMCLFGLSCGLSLTGCSQFVVINYLLHGPPTVEPDFDSETGLSMSNPGVTVAVVCFAPKELQWESPDIDEQISGMVARQMGQNHIKVIEPEFIRAWVDENPDWEKAEEIGKRFQTNYVVEIELAEYSLYEPNSTTLFRGRTEAYVHVVEMDESFEFGERIFTKEINFEFPTRVPRSSYDTSHTQFKKEYLSRLAERIGYLFYERFNGDMIGWAT